MEEVAIEIDEQDERANFLRTLRELCAGETKGFITIGILDNPSIRSHDELARILKCQPWDVKLGYDRLMRRADKVRLQLEEEAS